jgi:A/G-specific adenine glycosylase
MGQPEWEARKVSRVRSRLLEWYERNRATCPGGAAAIPTPSGFQKIMLQQTRVAVVMERYQAFMARFPTLPSLALGHGRRGAGLVERPRLLSPRANAAVRRHSLC